MTKSNANTQTLINKLANEKYNEALAKAKSGLAVSLALSEDPDARAAQMQLAISKAKLRLATQLKMAHDKTVRADQIELIKLKAEMAAEANPPKATAKADANTETEAIAAAVLEAALDGSLGQRAKATVNSLMPADVVTIPASTVNMPE